MPEPTHADILDAVKAGTERLYRLEKRLGRLERRLGRVEKRLARLEKRLGRVEGHLHKTQDLEREHAKEFANRLERIEKHVNLA